MIQTPSRGVHHPEVSVWLKRTWMESQPSKHWSLTTKLQLLHVRLQKVSSAYLYSNSGVNPVVEVEIRGAVVGSMRYPEIAVPHATVQLFPHGALLQWIMQNTSIINADEGDTEPIRDVSRETRYIISS